MFRLMTVLTLLLSILPAAVPSPARASTTRVAQESSGCVNNWYVSWGGISSYELLWTDPEAIPLEWMRFDYGYHDPLLIQSLTGYLDFNRNGLSDIFSAVPRPDGALQWRYWDMDSTQWNNLGYAYTDRNLLDFGDFNGDGRSDVFSTTLRPDGNWQWQYSPGGTAPFVNLAYANVPPHKLRFGDFNGDVKTDVFAALPAGDLYEWVYSSAGTASFVYFDNLKPLWDVDTTSLAFGDVQGEFVDNTSDGKTDVFLITTPDFDDELSYLWASIRSRTYSDPVGGTDFNRLRFGNFNQDAYTDIFFLEDSGFGYWLWNYIDGVDYSLHYLAYDTHDLEELAFGDFNGDHVTDVLYVEQVCSVYLPITSR